MGKSSTNVTVAIDVTIAIIIIITIIEFIIALAVRVTFATIIIITTVDRTAVADEVAATTFIARINGCDLCSYFRYFPEVSLACAVNADVIIADATTTATAARFGAEAIIFRHFKISKAEDSIPKNPIQPFIENRRCLIID